jgi:hypothetical protein
VSWGDLAAWGVALLGAVFVALFLAGLLLIVLEMI